MKNIQYDEVLPCLNCRKSLSLFVRFDEVVDFSGKDAYSYGTSVLLRKGARLEDPLHYPVDGELLLSGRCGSCSTMNYAKLKVASGTVIGIVETSRTICHVPQPNK